MGCESADQPSSLLVQIPASLPYLLMLTLGKSTDSIAYLWKWIFHNHLKINQKNKIKHSQVISYVTELSSVNVFEWASEGNENPALSQRDCKNPPSCLSFNVEDVTRLLDTRFFVQVAKFKALVLHNQLAILNLKINHSGAVLY